MSFVKYNRLIVYVFCTYDDSINNTANTSKKPDAILTFFVDELVLAGGDKAVPKILKEKPMIRFVQRVLRTSR